MQIFLFIFVFIHICYIFSLPCPFLFPARARFEGLKRKSPGWMERRGCPYYLALCFNDSSLMPPSSLRGKKRKAVSASYTRIFAFLNTLYFTFVVLLLPKMRDDVSACRKHAGAARFYSSKGSILPYRLCIFSAFNAFRIGVSPSALTSSMVPLSMCSATVGSIGIFATASTEN